MIWVRVVSLSKNCFMSGIYESSRRGIPSKASRIMSRTRFGSRLKHPDFESQVSHIRIKRMTHRWVTGWPATYGRHQRDGSEWVLSQVWRILHSPLWTSWICAVCRRDESSTWWTWFEPVSGLEESQLQMKSHSLFSLLSILHTLVGQNSSPTNGGNCLDVPSILTVFQDHKQAEHPPIYSDHFLSVSVPRQLVTRTTIQNNNSEQ